MKLEECCGGKPNVGCYKGKTKGEGHVKYVACTTCPTSIHLPASRTDIEICDSWNGVVKGEV